MRWLCDEKLKQFARQRDSFSSAKQEIPENESAINPSHSTIPNCEPATVLRVN